MKILLMTGFLISSAWALHDCGEYKISGTARLIKDTPFIIVNEDTRSEYRFSIPIKEQPKLAPYLNRPFELTAVIDNKMDGTKGKVKDLKEITLRAPHPLSDKPDTGLKLLKKIPCQK